MRRQAHLPRHLFKGSSRGRALLRITIALGIGLTVTSFSFQSGRPVIGQPLDNLTPSIGLVNDRSLHSKAPEAQEPLNKPTPPIEKQTSDDSEQMHKTITRLRTENEVLRKKVAQLEQIRKFDSVQERLTKEELRAQDLQTQLVGVAEKEASLQGRMDEVNEQLRPENIDQLQILGSLRPEQVRDATRRRLTGEKQRIQSQLDLLQQNRKRLQASLAVNDLVIQRLRAQLQTSLQP